MNGTVRSYENGKTLELDENGTTHTYDLSNTETTYRIDPNVRVGGNVKVTERTDSKGHKTVTVTPAKGKD